MTCTSPGCTRRRTSVPSLVCTGVTSRGSVYSLADFTGNVVRTSGMGIAVSVAPGAGAAVIADNLIAGAERGAIVGMEWKKPVTGDLAKDGAARYAQLAISGNRVR